MGLDYVSISSRRLYRIAHAQDFLVNVRSCNKGLLKEWIINKSSRKTIHYNHLTLTFYILSLGGCPRMIVQQLANDTDPATVVQRHRPPDVVVPKLKRSGLIEWCRSIFLFYLIFVLLWRWIIVGIQRERDITNHLTWFLCIRIKKFTRRAQKIVE